MEVSTHSMESLQRRHHGTRTARPAQKQDGCSGRKLGAGGAGGTSGSRGIGTAGG